MFLLELSKNILKMWTAYFSDVGACFADAHFLLIFQSFVASEHFCIFKKYLSRSNRT